MRILSLFICTLSMSLFAETYDTFVGRVSMLKGEATRVNEKDKNEINLKKGDKVYRGDMITTKDRSIIKLKLVDESLITIAPKSEFVLSEFSFKTKSNRSAIFKLLKGKIRSNIPIKSKPKALRYESTTAAMAVRGTRFLMNVHEDSNKANVTEYAVLEGEVEVTNKLDRKSYNAKPGDHVIVVKNQKGASKSHERKISQKELDRLNSLQDIQAMTNEQFMVAFETNMLGKPKNTGPKVRRKRNKKPESEDWENTLKKLNNRLKENRKDEES